MTFSLDQDLHIHSTLSTCCDDNNMTTETIANFAVVHGYREVCIADHVWSTAVAGAIDWYRSQDIAHISLNKPLPAIPGLSFYFGCETEYLGGNSLSITRNEFDLFDFVIIPVNHMHMTDFVRPGGIENAEDMATLVLTRLRELLQLSLPWEKIGIAHLSADTMYDEGSIADVLDAMDSKILIEIFSKLARLGAGVELNAGAFKEWESRRESFVRVYDIAAKAGCRFYLASDAHFQENLGGIQKHLLDVVKTLGLSEDQKYHIIT